MKLGGHAVIRQLQRRVDSARTPLCTVKVVPIGKDRILSTFDETLERRSGRWIT